MKKLLMIVVIAFVWLGFMPNQGSAIGVEPQMQVKLVNYLANQTSISLKVSGTYTLSGRTYRFSSAKSYTLKVTTKTNADGSIKPYISLYSGSSRLATRENILIKSSSRNDMAILNNHSYLGNFNFSVDNGRYVGVTNTIYLEDYLKCVVPSEMKALWKREALKSQAIAARSYAYFRLNKVIDDTTMYQFYDGTASLNSNSTAATQETAGQIITYNGKVIDTLFSASNGGMTESNSNAFRSDPLPYFSIQKDSYDTKIKWNPVIHKQQINPTGLDLRNPGTWWDKTYEADQQISNNMKAWLYKNGYSNKQIKIVGIPKLAFYDKTASGRVTKGDMEFSFYVKDQFDSTGKLQLQEISYTGVSANDVRTFIGTTVIKSTLISNMTETSSAYTISGSGYGHGVGMSQEGANNRANAGFKYNSILAFYYPHTVISKVY